jgi:putative heme transporter
VTDEPAPSRRHRFAWTIVRYAVGLAVGVSILLLLVGKRGELTAALRHLDHLNYAWESGAVAAEILSIVGYGFLQQRVLRWGGAELSLASLTLVSLANNAIAYSVPGEPAVSSAYRYRFFRRHGASGATSGWAILTILIAQAIGMSLLLLVGVIVALFGHTGVQARGTVVVGLFVVVIAGALLVRRDLLLRFLGVVVRLCRRLTGHPRGDVMARIESTLQRMREIPLSSGAAVGLVVMATALWLMDFVILICSFGAVHAAVPWSGVLLAFGVAQIVASLPLIPGGIGIVEGSLAVILVAYGARKVPALAVVLICRLLTFWLVIIVGWVGIGVIEWRVRRGPARASEPSVVPATES